jgi:hypothetical protein
VPENIEVRRIYGPKKKALGFEIWRCLFPVMRPDW